jgi:hypothetical protein
MLDQEGIVSDSSYVYGNNPMTGDRCPSFAPIAQPAQVTITPAAQPVSLSASSTSTTTPSSPLLPSTQSPYIPSVTPGEVCTIDMAKQYLGVTNIQDIYSASGSWSNLQIYNPLVDQDKHATSKICQQSDNDPNKVYPYCSVQAGVGYRRMISDPSKCITASCPPGFSNIGGNTCDKTPLLQDYNRNIAAYCEEQWYDWFTTPNYHLGNNYSNVLVAGDNSNIVRCWKPCPSGQLPEYHVDPVDNATFGDGINNLTQCVSKNDYFYGKYAGSDELCPLAVIHAVTLSPAVASSNMHLIYSQLQNSSNGTTNDAYDYAVGNIDANAQTISQKAASMLPTDVQLPDDRTQRACNSIQTPDRLNYAYAQCSNLNAHPEQAATMFQHLQNPTQAAIIMKKACNAVFSNPASTALNIINQPSIYFTGADVTNTSVPKINQDPYDSSLNVTPIDVSQIQTPSTPKEVIKKPNTLYSALIMLMLFIFLPFLLYLLYRLVEWLMSGYVKGKRIYHKSGIPGFVVGSWNKVRGIATNHEGHPYPTQVLQAKDAISKLTEKLEELETTRKNIASELASLAKNKAQ